MKLYVDKEDIKQSVNYFKNSGIAQEPIFDIFLISKHLGITESRPISFGSRGNEIQKDKALSSLFDLGGLIGPNEYFESHSLAFPNCFMNTSSGSKKYYQPGTAAPKVFPRIKDTIKNAHNFGGIFTNEENDSDSVVLAKNYRDLIKSNLLNGNKVALSSLAAWLYRFTPFDFKEENVTETTFTRVVRKTIYKYFNINQRDFSWLFEDNLRVKLLHPSKKPISGEEFRTLLGVDEDVYENNETVQANNADGENSFVHFNDISQKETTRYSELTGDNPSVDTIFTVLKDKKQIILTGVPGIGKSMYSTELSQKDFFKKMFKVQFHANYSYEDFIGGNVFENDEHSHEMVVKSKKGKFLEAVDIAKNHEDNNYLFVIDEINRGNIAAILGESILTLDREYTVQLSQPIDGIKEFSIPDNLYIVGTMNTSDRNIAFLDMAIRRRFSFIELKPNYDFVSEKIMLNVSVNNEKVSYNLGAILENINKNIVRVTQDNQKALGQSYLIPNNGSEWGAEEFHNQFIFGILPTIKEYNYQKANADRSILGDSLCDEILDVDKFYEAFDERFGEFRF
jgi:5-methylcytosine-specific restriction protein B